MDALVNPLVAVQQHVAMHSSNHLVSGSMLFFVRLSCRIA